MAYIILPIPRDVATAEEASFDVLRAQWPDWQPLDPDPITMLMRASAQLYADVASLATKMGEEAFRFYGRSVPGLLPIDDTPATATVTFTASDANGPYEIGEDTELSGQGSTGEPVGFRLVAPVTIPNGATTASGDVEALVEGSAGNGIVGTAELEEYLDFGETTITAVFDNPSSGGTDAESDSDYLDRLAERERLAEPKPVLTPEFAAMARLLGAHRATAINGLNPADGTTDNPLTVTISMIDEAGEIDPDAAGIALAIQALREQNFVVHSVSPTYHTIDVNYAAVAYPGWDTAAVKVAADEALARRLSPDYHGIREDSGETRVWINQPSIRYLEVAEAIQRVEGVNYVTMLQTKLSAGGTLGTTDLALTGFAPLPRPGDIDGTISAG